MHELSLAQAVIEIAEAEAKKRNAAAAKTIKLRLGEFTGVIRDVLDIGFEAALGACPRVVDLVRGSSQCGEGSGTKPECPLESIDTVNGCRP